MWVSVFICGPAYPCLTSQLVFFQPLISMAGPRATLVWDLGQIRHHHHHMTDSLITWEPQVPTGGPAWSSVNTWDTFGWCLLVFFSIIFITSAIMGWIWQVVYPVLSNTLLLSNYSSSSFDKFYLKVPALLTLTWRNRLFYKISKHESYFSCHFLFEFHKPTFFSSTWLNNNACWFNNVEYNDAP